MNGLDERISTRGFFERILQEQDKVNSERDKRLDERFEASEKAVSAALAAAEKAVIAALAASEKAVDKAEVAQQRVNATQNEFRATLKDQAADLMPRAETELLIRELRGTITEVRQSRDPLLANLRKGLEDKIEPLDSEINHLRQDHVGRTEVDALKSFQSKLLGAMALATVVVPSLTGVIVFVVTH
jgi:hypothetical protein